MQRTTSLILGSIFGLLGVALGAFGAHALKPALEVAGRVETYELATRYLFYHAFALLILGIMPAEYTTKLFRLAPVFFLSGILCFSGSLYALSLTDISWVVFITPLGGAMLLAGWVVFLLGLLSVRKKNSH